MTKKNLWMPRVKAEAAKAEAGVHLAEAKRIAEGWADGTIKADAESMKEFGDHLAAFSAWLDALPPQPKPLALARVQARVPLSRRLAAKEIIRMCAAAHLDTKTTSVLAEASLTAPEVQAAIASYSAIARLDSKRASAVRAMFTKAGFGGKLGDVVASEPRMSVAAAGKILVELKGQRDRAMPEIDGSISLAELTGRKGRK